MTATLLMVIISAICAGTSPAADATLNSLLFRTSGNVIRVLDDYGNPGSSTNWSPTTTWPILCVRTSTPGLMVDVTVQSKSSYYYIKFQGLGPDGIVYSDG